MKILAIMGSPHKGSSYQVITQIEDQLTQAGDVQFEALFLKDANLIPCRGCFVCFAKGEEHCPIKDDQRRIEAQMQQADGVIFVSPVYGMMVSGLFKNFVDRFSYIFHRPRFFGKHALAVATTGGMGLKPTLNYLSGVAEAWGFHPVAKLGVIAPPAPMRLSSSVARKNERKIAAATQKLYAALQDQRKPSPSLMALIGFRAGRLAACISKDIYGRDYRYYEENGWLDQEYYYDVPINPARKLIAVIAEKIISRQFRNMYDLPR